MTARIDHVAIAVENLDEAIGLFEKILGFRISSREAVPEHEVETATFRLGDTAVELVEGSSEGSVIRKFVEARGPGIHHIALSVEDLGEAVERLKAGGIVPLDEEPRPGKDGSRVAFLHPKSTMKVLIELVQPSGGARDTG